MGHTPQGPWTEIANGSFPDLRNETMVGYAVVVPLTVIRMAEAHIGRFAKFQCDTWWGDGCALHYLGGSDKDTGMQFNRTQFGLSFGLKNRLRFNFDSETCLKYPFLNIFLVLRISSQNSSGFSSRNSSQNFNY